MKIQILADLHLEHFDYLRTAHEAQALQDVFTSTDSDVVVLAGDTHMGVVHLGRSEYLAGWSGGHEYYLREYHQALTEIRKEAARPPPIIKKPPNQGYPVQGGFSIFHQSFHRPPPWDEYQGIHIQRVFLSKIKFFVAHRSLLALVLQEERTERNFARVFSIGFLDENALHNTASQLNLSRTWS